MNDSMAQPEHAFASFELAGWKNALNWLGAILISLLFLVSGLWKITGPTGAAVRMAQARLPEFLSVPAAVGFGIVETFAGVLVLVPRFRRWGAWLTSSLLLAFLVYFALNYNALRGADCSCFPWVKRVVGPGFFISDGIMLGLALVAWRWAKPSSGVRSALLVLGAVTVFAFISYGVAATRQTGTRAPDAITVNGRPYSLQQGKTFIYYFDPECMHCAEAAKRMSTYNWAETRVVVVPIQQAQFAATFLQDAGLRAGISNDLAALKKVFPFTAVPAGVAIQNGREVKDFTQFEGDQPGAALKEIGFIE